MIEEYARHCGHADLLRNGSTAASASDGTLGKGRSAGGGNTGERKHHPLILIFHAELNGV